MTEPKVPADLYCETCLQKPCICNNTHDWRLAGASTASDGYVCSKCGLHLEVHADESPAKYDAGPCLADDNMRLRAENDALKQRVKEMEVLAHVAYSNGREDGLEMAADLVDRWADKVRGGISRLSPGVRQMALKTAPIINQLAGGIRSLKGKADD